jgi:hypothetical protein
LPLYQYRITDPIQEPTSRASPCSTPLPWPSSFFYTYAIISRLVMFWLWPQAKKPWLFGFGTKAKAKPPISRWLGLRFGQAKVKFRPNFPLQAMALALARLRIFESQTHGF